MRITVRQIVVGALATMSIGAAIPHTGVLNEPGHSETGRPAADAPETRLADIVQGTPPTVATVDAQRELDGVFGFLDCCALQVQHEIDAYLAALEAARIEAERLAAEEAARQAAAAAVARARTTVARTSPTVVSGDCSSVAAIIGWGIVNRESGGNPSAVNGSSGAYGCSQTLPSHYAAGGVCAGLNMYTVEGQTACTQILYDRGGLAPWSSTR